MNRFLFTSTALVALLAAPALAQDAENQSVLLETINVDSSSKARPVGVPTFAQQERRFLRRPGAETVIDMLDKDPGTVGSPRAAFAFSPGVYTTDRSSGNEGLISIRGSDIASSGPRGGRGVRAYIDGIPLGRNDAGLTAAFLNPNPAQYIEVYRGGSALRYGSLSTGGAFNVVSKTGLSSPGTGLTFIGGSFGSAQTVLEHGGSKGEWDWFFQGSGYHHKGQQQHTRELTGRFDANIGYRPNADFESRFFLSAGTNNVELAQTVRLDQLKTQGKLAGALALKSDQDRNFHYTRLANKTTMRFDNTTLELGGYYLFSHLDHLPTPYSGMVDYKWNDFGAFARVEHKNTVFSMPAEFVAGTRLNYTKGDFKQFQWANSGQEHGRLSRAWDFNGWLWENYGESAIEVAKGLKIFTGAQAVYIKRDQTDVYQGGTFAPVNNPNNPVGPQPGRLAGKYAEFDLQWRSFNPKLGANYEYAKNHFVFANVSRSFEAPTNSDMTDVLNSAKSLNIALPAVKPQTAWTFEAGLRGGWERFQYDITAYHMRLRNEILTRCVSVAEGGRAGCQDAIAFNSGKSIHQGLEMGFKAVLLESVARADDKVFLNGVWNINDFRFDGDSRFGNARMPVIPMHQVMAELGYRMAGGFFVSGSARYLSQRLTTFDNKGGGAFKVPAVTLLGAKIGWVAPDKSWSAFVEGRNLANKVYASDFSATSTVSGVSPQVRRGEGRAVYAGVSKRF